MINYYSIAKIYTVKGTKNSTVVQSWARLQQNVISWCQLFAVWNQWSSSRHWYYWWRLDNVQQIPHNSWWKLRVQQGKNVYGPCYIMFLYMQICLLLPWNRRWLSQIEAGLVQKQYIAKVIGEFPELEVWFCLSWLAWVIKHKTNERKGGCKKKIRRHGSFAKLIDMINGCCKCYSVMWLNCKLFPHFTTSLCFLFSKLLMLT